MENKKKNRKDRNKSHIPFRLNLLFFIIFLLFVTLIIRLGYLQIIQGEEFKAEVERTESTTVRGNVPRGEIFDSKLRPLVANEAKIRLCTLEERTPKLKIWHKLRIT